MLSCVLSCIRLFWVAGLLLATAIGTASAEAPKSPEAPKSEPAPKSQAERRPPVLVKGWRYELRPNDVHMFICDQPACGAQSRVSYRLYAPGNTMTLDKFREDQTQIVKVLEQRTPGQKISILGIEGDSGTAVPRMFKARRLMVKPDGTKEYQVSGMLFGARGAASVISSAAAEKPSSDNYAQFAAGVMIFLVSGSR